ncbi:MAG: hypothetical protein EXR52_01045 [Dehalococcoidia bacterium]|nr:hypothetical protein [Dehalococcoidia bacterium]
MHISLPRPLGAPASAPALPKIGPQWVPAGVFLGALVFAGTTVLIAQTSMETAAGYEVGRLEGLKTLEQQQNQRLEAEVAALKSLDRIEQIAVDRLKMIKPKNYTYITVDRLPPTAAETTRSREEAAYRGDAASAEPWWERLLSGLTGQKRTQ